MKTLSETVAGLLDGIRLEKRKNVELAFESDKSTRNYKIILRVYSDKGKIMFNQELGHCQNYIPADIPLIKTLKDGYSARITVNGMVMAN